VLFCVLRRNSYELPASCIRHKGDDLFSRVFSRNQAEDDQSLVLRQSERTVGPLLRGDVVG